MFSLRTNILSGDLRGLKEWAVWLLGKEHSKLKEEQVQRPQASPLWECKSSCVWSREEGERSGGDESERRGFRGRSYEIKTGLCLFSERDKKMLEVVDRGVTWSDMISQKFLSYCVDRLHFYTPSQFVKYFHTQHPTTPHFPDERTEAQRNKNNFPGIANEGVSPEQTILYRI